MHYVIILNILTGFAQGYQYVGCAGAKQLPHSIQKDQ